MGSDNKGEVIRIAHDSLIDSMLRSFQGRQITWYLSLGQLQKVISVQVVLISLPGSVFSSCLVMKRPYHPGKKSTSPARSSGLAGPLLWSRGLKIFD